MAVVKTVMKNTPVEAVVKVQGTAAAATISLATDLLGSTEVIEGTPSASISGVVWSGGTDGIIQITRNSVVIMTLQTTAAGMMEFNGQMMIPDNIEAASDIVVTISGAQCECWLRIKKNTGYKSKIETSVFGQYDDPTKAGE